jgi:hypothetical protein
MGMTRGMNVTEKEKFDATMKNVLSLSKAELQRRLQAQKKAEVRKR